MIIRIIILTGLIMTLGYSGFSQSIFPFSDSSTQRKPYAQTLLQLNSPQKQRNFNIDDAKRELDRSDRLPGFPSLSALGGNYDATELNIRMVAYLQQLTRVMAAQEKRLKRLEEENAELKAEVLNLKSN